MVRLAALILLAAPAGPVTIGLVAAGPAAAQTADRTTLREAEGEAGAARTALGAAAREAREAEARERALAARRAEAGRRAVAAEEALAAAEARLEAAEHARDAAEAEAARRAEAIAPLIPAMRRLNLWPAETLLAVPAPPAEALRGALVLRGVAHRLTEEAAAYRRLREEADRTARDAGEERARLTAAREGRERAEAARQAREAETQTRREAARRPEPDPPRADPPRPEPGRPEPTRPAAVTPAPGPMLHRGTPVAGSVTREFGTAGSTGQSWAAAPGARVVSPCTGRIVFSGPFRSYGRMLIVDCGGGYHFVLAGLDRLDGDPGQRVGAGEAVGTVGGPRNGETGRGALYLELRRAGQAVDPRGWPARG